MSNSAPTPSPTRQAPIPVDRCGLALAADRLGDRWTMLILREAFYGVSRFDDLQADLKAPRGVLSSRLKALIADGLLEKRPYRDGAARPRQEYRLTPRGQDLGLVLIALMQWGDRHLQETPSPLRLTDRKTGEPLHVALVTSRGQVVATEDVEVSLAPR